MSPTSLSALQGNQSKTPIRLFGSVHSTCLLWSALTTQQGLEKDEECMGLCNFYLAKLRLLFPVAESPFSFMLLG